MPSIGANRDAGDVIDVVGIDNNGFNGNMTPLANGNGTVNDKIMAINRIPEKTISLEQFLTNLVNSGNQKHEKLALDLIGMDLTQEKYSETLGSDCFDKISVKDNENSNNDQGQDINTGKNNESDMEWTTVRSSNKRSRSRTGSNDIEKINLETTVSPSKKHKTTDNKVQGQSGQYQGKPGPINKNRNELNKDSVLIVVTEIPDNTYFNAIRMENMILKAFPRIKETGIWRKYRINKRHKNKCYVTLPKDHFEDNVPNVIKSQLGFETSKVKVINGVNNVPEKTHKVVAIGVHQTVSEDDIKTELAKSNIKINKVQRLKFNGQPTRKVVIEFENEQDMKIALFSGIYFGRIRIRCESYRTTPPVTQCYKCQGFNHIAKDCKKEQKCVRCAGAHKSTECPDKDKASLKPKCSNCNGDHVASSRECPKFKDQVKIQADKAKARQEKLQNSLVVRGITFSNMVQNKTEKVQSELTEKIQTNKKETELELGNIVQKLESKMEESFKALSERIVSFMVNSMVEIYEQLDKKNADKVYNILSKESVDCFNIKLHPISPPLSPSASVATSVTQVDSSKHLNKTKKPNTQGVLSKQVHPPRQVPIIQKIAAPRHKKFQNGSKK